MNLLKMIKAEFVRGLRVDIRYPLNLVAELATLSVLYLGIYWVNRSLPGEGFQGSNSALASLVGFVMWYFLVIAVGALSTNLQSEAEQGTLEQLFLIPAGTAQLLLARLGSAISRGSLSIAVIFGVMMLATGVRPIWRLGPALVVILISLVGLVGVGYALVGLTLLYKRTGSLIGLVNLILLIIMGIFNDATVGPVAVVVRVLPLAYGSRLLQQALGEVAPPAGSVWAIDLFGLTLNSLIYLIAGLAIFRKAERTARQRGVLAHF